MKREEPVAPAVILAAEAKAARKRAMNAPDPPLSPDAEAEKSAGNRKLAAGIAMGIGSAALVAALLYASRGKKEPGKPG